MRSHLRARCQAERPRRRAAFTLIEILIASGIMTAVLLACMGLLLRDGQLSRSTLGIALAETRAQQMLHALQRELCDARGTNPKAVVTLAIASGTTGALQVDSTLGFPDSGMLIVDRGTAGPERIRYDALGAGLASFVTLTRGEPCTQASGHAVGAEVLWAGLAEPVALGANPPPGTFDGRALEPDGPVFFRGEGTGFSYRVPTDPAGGTDYLDGDDLQWGAVAGGQPTLSGWTAVVFVARDSFREAEAEADLNKDGDQTDVFDVGQIRRRAWDTSDPSVVASDLGLGPAVILQERCHHGGDLDGDGFDDPIFLWDAATRRLHVRLFVLGRSVQDMPITREVEGMIFFRNEAGT